MVSNVLDIKLSDFQEWGWDKIQPLYEALQAYPLSADNAIEWLTAWTRLSNLIEETSGRLYVGTTVNTADTVTEQKYFAYLNEVIEPSSVASQSLKQKLLETGIEPEGYDEILKGIRVDAALFRDENVPLFTEESKLTNEYDKTVGAQTVQWDGEEKTIPALLPLFLDTDRSVREKAWKLRADRQLADRQTLNDLWVRLLKLRIEIAENANEPNYMAYQWKSYHRFAYSPEDCQSFADAIEQVVVPAAEKIYEKRRQQLGVDTLRHWDVDVDPLGRAALKPFSEVEDLVEKTESIFKQIDPHLGDLFTDMKYAELLDLDNRKNKAPGGYCTTFPVTRRPYIFMNSVGIHDDVQTLLHEGGHAFHAYETFTLPEYRQGQPPIEFCEVASMSMEMIGGPYLAASKGGFYSEADAARARIEYLEGALMFWPYMAVVDSFQRWVYTNVQEALDPANCDAKWGELWDRFMKGIDYTGFEDVKNTGWHRKLHIFQIPFYYVEYGIAQLGAVQVWLNSMKDQTKAVADYRKALALGGTVPLPELFEAAGARLAMDAPILTVAVDAIMNTVEELEAV